MSELQRQIERIKAARQRMAIKRPPAPEPEPFVEPVMEPEPKLKLVSLPVLPDQFIDRFCETKGVARKVLLSKTRVKLIVRLRFELMHDLRRRYKHLSYVRIGQLMGGMDHASVIHGVRRHLEGMD